MEKWCVDIWEEGNEFPAAEVFCSRAFRVNAGKGWKAGDNVSLTLIKEVKAVVFLALYVCCALCQVLRGGQYKLLLASPLVGTKSLVYFLLYAQGGS